MKLIDYESGREDFMAVVYDELRADPDNLRANRIIDAMDAIPTIDAEPVVCCRDCAELRRSYDGSGLVCGRTTSYRREDDFCSYGQRKEQHHEVD